MGATAITPSIFNLQIEARSSDVVISQIYGGGGNPGATYTHDFIELFNRGTTPVSLVGWSVQYTSSAGTTWQVTQIAGTINPGQYLLIQEAAGSGGTTPLPTPDVIGNINIGATSGKVALVNTTTALIGNCPSNNSIVDFVGYGPAQCFEGANPAPGLTNTLSAQRKGSGCVETDNNVADFLAGSVDPRNTASPLHLCNPTVVVGTGTTPSCTEAAFDAALYVVQSSGGGTITFNCGGPATITFTTGKIIATAVVTIDGGGQITLSGDNSVRHFYVDSDAALTLQNITLSDGYDNTFGGGSILSLGTSLTLENSTIRDSNVDPTYSGGAILSYGIVAITNSLIDNNSGGSVGGLFLIGANAIATISDSTFQNNRTTNSAYGLGGAITVWDGAAATLLTSTLEQNQAQQGGAIYLQDGVVTIDNTTIDGNSATFNGGGIKLEGGTLSVTHSTLSNNTAAIGGGIDTSALTSLSFVNVTMSQNSAEDGGGLALVNTQSTLDYITFYNNTATQSGNSIYVSDGATILKNVILQADSGSNCAISSGAITSNGFNLASDNSCNLTGNGDLQSSDAHLDPLNDNGGFTLTHLPQLISPAVDSGQCTTGIDDDQRGVLRPQNGICDRGAVERLPDEGIEYLVFLPSVVRLAPN